MDWRSELSNMIYNGNTHGSFLQAWPKLVQQFQRRFKCDLFSKYTYFAESAERKISQKNMEYMLNYSLPCTTYNVAAVKFVLILIDNKAAMDNSRKFYF